MFYRGIFLHGHTPKANFTRDGTSPTKFQQTSPQEEKINCPLVPCSSLRPAVIEVGYKAQTTLGCSDLLHTSVALGQLSPAPHEHILCILRAFPWQDFEPTPLVQHTLTKGHSASVKATFKHLGPPGTPSLPPPAPVSAVSWHIWGWRAGQS